MKRPHPEKTTGLNEAIERPTGAVGVPKIGDEYFDEAKSTVPLTIERGMEPEQSMSKHPRRVLKNTSEKALPKRRGNARWQK